MAIYDKRHVTPYLEELEEYYERLVNEVRGTEPDDVDPEEYRRTKEQLLSQFVQIDFDKVETQIDYFRVAVNHLKKLKKHNLPKQGS